MLRRLISSLLVPALLLPLLLAGCVVSTKDLSEDLAAATPLEPGTYTNLLQRTSVDIALNGLDYRVDNATYRFFPISGSEDYILQSRSSGAGAFNYLFARVFDDTLVIYAQTFGSDENVPRVPDEFTGRVSASIYGYEMRDISATADFLSLLGRQSNLTLTVRAILKKAD